MRKFGVESSSGHTPVTFGFVSAAGCRELSAGTQPRRTERITHAHWSWVSAMTGVPAAQMFSRRGVEDVKDRGDRSVLTDACAKRARLW